jgi:hypothetical protein
VRARHAAREAQVHEQLRQQFTPHLWVEHRPGRPSCAIACVAAAGLDHFKRIDIPQHVLDINAMAQRLEALTVCIRQLPSDGPTWSRLNFGFGAPLVIHYRNAFDRYYSYDCTRQQWSVEHHGQPPIPRIFLGLRSSSCIVHV